MQSGYRIRIVICLVLLALFSAIVYAQTNPEVKPDAAGMLPELNKWRTAIGLRPLQVDIPLSMAAQFHADDMVARNYFEHIAPSPVDCNGTMVKEPPQRVACFGRAGRGEDLAVDSSPESAVRAWLGHYPHCVDVLKPIYTHMGGGSNGRTYAAEFDGQVEPDTPVNVDVFCGCTSGNGSEENIASCVKKFNDQFNNGATPPTLPTLPLQVKMRLPGDKNKTYDKNSSGGQTIGSFVNGTMTVKVIPVAGNPAGIPIELGDGRFNKIPGASGTDELVYEITQPGEFSINFTSWSLAQGDKFTLEILWLPVDAAQAGTDTPVDVTASETETPAGCSMGGTGAEMTVSIANNSAEPLTLNWLDFQCNESSYATIEPGTVYDQPTFDGHEWVLRNAAGDVVNQFVALQSAPSIIIDGQSTDAPAETPEAQGCAFTVASVDELVNAINQANDEQQCPGPDSIFLVSDIVLTASYDGGANAFPPITTAITISSMNRQIARDPNAPAFRFFYVDGTTGKSGTLTLEDIQLRGGDAGDAFDGGAVFVDARDGGTSWIHTRNVAFLDNKSTGNGGALMTLSLNGGTVEAVIEGGVFDNNSGAYGGAFYSGGFDGGNATATITNTNFTGNSASAEGGALYNNGLGNGGHAHMTLTDVTFSGSVSPRGDFIHNNGRTGGDATLTLKGNLADGTGITFEGTGLILNQGADNGSAITTWKDTQAGGNDNICVGNSEDGVNLSVVPCP